MTLGDTLRSTPGLESILERYMTLGPMSDEEAAQFQREGDRRMGEYFETNQARFWETKRDGTKTGVELFPVNLEGERYTRKWPPPYHNPGWHRD